MMPVDTGDDPLATALLQRDIDALAGMTADVAALPRATFALRSENLIGIEALQRFTDGEDEQSGSVQSGAVFDHTLPTLDTLVDEIERPGKGLVMFMGKGGVGKTTMAAAVATELAARGHEVLLSTTDPAAHITETLAGDMQGLTVSRIDPEAETALYHEHVMATKGHGS